jgi:hypothetical protein
MPWIENELRPGRCSPVIISFGTVPEYLFEEVSEDPSSDEAGRAC